MKKINWLVIAAGAAVGAAALILQALGNPANMGFCIACFERDIAGALGLHSAAKVQYLRPEIFGLVLGAFLAAAFTKEFRSRAGSSPATRFFLGACVIIGALAFLGCPLRMVLRLGGGDGNALTGLAGFAAGIAAGVGFLKKGFTLQRAYPAGKAEGSVLPALSLLLLALGLAAPALFRASTEGPGSKHAPALIAFAIALTVGVLAQRARLCMAGGIRDMMLFRDWNLLSGFAALFLTVLLGNLLMGSFHPGFTSQPIAHSAHLWNFLGMVIVGWGSVLLGGCPLRQLILAGEGNSDSAVTVLGMVAGTAVAHNFALAGNADAVNEAGQYITGGISPAGKAAVAAILVILLAISVVNSRQEVAKS